MHYIAPAKFTLSHENTALMVHKLRNANERYARIAEQIRTRMKSRQCRPYRIRAAWLGLHVDIGAAIALCNTQVSKIPLPILDTTTPSPVEPIRIPPSHMRPTQLPSIIATAPTPMVLTDVNRVNKIYSPVPIPPRGPLVHFEGIDWAVPRAPLLKPRELPVISPQTYCGGFSPMLMDSDSSGLSTPEDRYAANKRKIRDIDVDDTLSHKHHLRKHWVQATSTRRVACQPSVYF